LALLGGVSGLERAHAVATSVTGTVFRDHNVNGAMEADEPVPGVTVDGYDAAGDHVGPVQTNATGGYSLPFAAAGPVRVEVTPPAPYVESPHGATGSTVQFTTAGTDHVDVALAMPGDGGPQAPTELGNRVWLDSNGNGVQDPGEPPIRGVTVHLYAAAGGAPLATALTAATGANFFSAPPATDLVVRLDHGPDYDIGGALVGLVLTRTAAGASRSIDSDGILTAPQVDAAAITTAGPGTANHTVDFGFTPPYAVGDMAFRDTNSNGLQDAGEPGVPRVTATLQTPTGGPVTHPDGTPVAPVTTDPVGHYVFDDLAAGAYRVAFSGIPAGYRFTTQQVGLDPEVDSNPDGTGATPAFTLGPIGSQLPQMDFPMASDGILLASAIDRTIDAGLRPVATDPVVQTKRCHPDRPIAGHRRHKAC
jgi:hypothetical protein